MRRNFVPALALALAVTACSGGGTSAPTSIPQSTSIPGSASAPPSPVTGTATATTNAPSGPTSFGYVPLWPFASVAAAEQWQREALQAGHQPWRLDAGEVAVAFARQYLGFVEIDLTFRTSRCGYLDDLPGGSSAALKAVRDRASTSAMSSRSRRALSNHAW